MRHIETYSSVMNEHLDYEGVTLELNGDMAEHEQDYRTTAKVGSMFTTN